MSGGTPMPTTIAVTGTHDPDQETWVTIKSGGNTSERFVKPGEVVEADLNGAKCMIEERSPEEGTRAEQDQAQSKPKRKRGGSPLE